MRILITGFDPFGNQKVNPAIEVVKRLPDRIDSTRIIKLKIPTEFVRSVQFVKRAIQRCHPDYVLNIGQAGGREGITPELVAINLDDARIPDNASDRPLNQPIFRNGEPAYFTELPVKAIVRAIRKSGLPSRLSTTAGTFVCNHIMYATQYLRDYDFPKLKAGFIHIPLLSGQAVGKLSGQPTLTMKQDVKGLTAALETIIKLNGKLDLKVLDPL